MEWTHGDEAGHGGGKLGAPSLDHVRLDEECAQGGEPAEGSDDDEDIAEGLVEATRGHFGTAGERGSSSHPALS